MLSMFRKVSFLFDPSSISFFLLTFLQRMNEEQAFRQTNHFFLEGIFYIQVDRFFYESSLKWHIFRATPADELSSVREREREIIKRRDS
jgi:hypothetical protein